MFIFNLLRLLLLLAAASIALAQFPKRGLPYNDPPVSIESQNWNQPGSQVNWAYNWGSNMDPNFPWFLEYIPMLWGDAPVHTDSWFNDVNNARSRGSGHIMAFNEPNECGWGQACMDPVDAANAYRAYLMPFADVMALGGPAVSNGPNGFSWLAQWFYHCGDCKVDFVPFYWYGYDIDSNVDVFIKYVEDAYYYAGGDSGGRKIWITEFSIVGSTDQQIAFLQAVIPWLDSRNYVYRYSWFWASPSYTGGSLVDYNGNPTALGNFFAYAGY